MQQDIFVYADPWELCSVAEKAMLSEEILREVKEDHALGGYEFEVIARTNLDYVLVRLKNAEFEYATVQLTWTLSPSNDIPHIALWVSHNEWANSDRRDTID